MRSCVRLDVADRDGEEEFAAARLLLQGFQRALAEQRQLHLAHRALHAEQQPIVRVARIVDAVLVDDQRADQAAELQQRVPVAAVAGEPRGLDRDHGADPALADRGEQLLEARPGDAGAGAAEIVVDHLDGGPAQRAGAIGKAILPAPALVIVEHLVGGRLADVDEGAAGQVLRRDLGHRRPPRPSRAVASGWPTPAASVSRLWSSGASLARRSGRRSGSVVLSLEQIPLTASFAPHRRLPRGGAIPRRHEARSASTRARSSASRSTGKPRMRNELVRGGRGLGHPGRQQRQGPVGLPDDEVSAPAWRLTPTTATISPLRGWNGYVIRTSNAGHPAV